MSTSDFFFRQLDDTQKMIRFGLVFSALSAFRLADSYAIKWRFFIRQSEPTEEKKFDFVIVILVERKLDNSSVVAGIDSRRPPWLRHSHIVITVHHSEQ